MAHDIHRPAHIAEMYKTHPLHEDHSHDRFSDDGNPNHKERDFNHFPMSEHEKLAHDNGFCFCRNQSEVNPSPDFPSIQFPKPYSQLKAIRAEISEHDRLYNANSGSFDNGRRYFYYKMGASVERETL